MAKVTKVTYTLENRPGCAVGYALYMWFYAVLLFLLGLLLAFLLVTSMDGSVTQMVMVGGGVLVITGAFVVIPLLLGLGVWRMHRWGYWFGLITHVGIALLFLLGAGLATVSDGQITAAELGVPGLLFAALNFILALWFWTNEREFRPGRTVASLSSDPVTRVKMLFTLPFLIVPILVVLCGCGMVILTTFYGSQLGQIFSDLAKLIMAQPVP